MTIDSVRTYRGWFWGLALAGLTLDLATKQLAFSLLAPGEPGRIEVVPGFFSIVHQDRLNRGALFGWGNTEETGHQANLLFAGLSALAVIGIAAWSFRASLARDRLLCCALGLILGGAGGNLFDRLAFGGVRDFLWVYCGNVETRELSFDWPVFNLADAWLLMGAVLLLYQAFFVAPPAKPQTAS